MVFSRAVLAIVLFFVAAPLSAQDSGGLKLELNRLQPQPEACRTYLLFANELDANFSKLVLDLVFFDSDGIIARRSLVDAAPLPAAKTVVKIFDVADVDCANLGKVLLNAVQDCETDGAKIEDCLSVVSLSSRSDVIFYQ